LSQLTVFKPFFFPPDLLASLFSYSSISPHSSYVFFFPSPEELFSHTTFNPLMAEILLFSPLPLISFFLWLRFSMCLLRPEDLFFFPPPFFFVVTGWWFWSSHLGSGTSPAYFVELSLPPFFSLKKPFCSDLMHPWFVTTHNFFPSSLVPLMNFF